MNQRHEDDDVVSIVASVGTDHHPFDRLITWLDRFAADHPSVSVFVQAGTSGPPRTCGGADYLATGELADRMERAAAIVSHGGPATIMGARAAGCLPIVVPRRAALGEHVDDHQVRFARWMADRDQIVVADTEAALHRLLEAATADPNRYRLVGDGAGAGAPAIRRFGDLVDGLLA